jgi:site-specific DNA-methyltransferase (adenine-specific)
MASPHPVHFSSATDEWPTPAALFQELSWCFGGFDLDPCATSENAKCSRYFTKQLDGLARRWQEGSRPVKVFINPPYGRAIGKWVRKAWEESQRGGLVVCLLPARTDTTWWQDYARKGHVYFVRGRLKFGGAKNAAPFPSAIVVFGKFFSQDTLLRNIVEWKVSE